MNNSIPSDMEKLHELLGTHQDLFLSKEQYYGWLYYNTLAHLPETEENKAYIRGVLKRKQNEGRVNA